MIKKRIAIDMDDVMAAAGKKILFTYNSIIGTDFRDHHFEGKAYYDVLKEEHYHIIREEIFKPGFFRNMEVMPNAVEVIKKLHERFDIFIEQMYSEGREKAVSGEFTFVAIDETKAPIKIHLKEKASETHTEA